jgi:hypothetical protein
MSDTLRVYSPQEVTVDWGGFVTIKNFAEGTAIEAARAVENTNNTVGMQGDVGITFVANKTGTISFTIMQTGEVNAILSAIQREQDKTGELFRADLNIKDPSGSSLATYGACHIMTPATMSMGDDQQSKTWTFFVERFDYTSSPVGLTQPNGAAARILNSVQGIRQISDALKSILGA